MSEISAKAFARAGLLGNPSDGYHGKSISFTIRNFSAEVCLRPSSKLRISSDWEADHQYDSIRELSNRVAERGFYGAGRLITAAIHRFFRFVSPTVDLPARNFEVSYTTNIPRQVGLAGSSSIVVATLRALCLWYNVTIPPHLLASLSLAAETDLGIPAGLQDRVIQAMEGLVFMDFSADAMRCEQDLEFGKYESLDPTLLKNIYVAYTTHAGQPTEILHNDLRRRFDSGDSEVIETIQQLASLAERGKAAILKQDHVQLGQFINQNFDLRKKICRLDPRHVEMVETARNCGASAKFCGSGGAIVGTYGNPEILTRLREQLMRIGCKFILPKELIQSPATET